MYIIECRFFFTWEDDPPMTIKHIFQVKHGVKLATKIVKPKLYMIVMMKSKCMMMIVMMK